MAHSVTTQSICNSSFLDSNLFKYASKTAAYTFSAAVIGMGIAAATTPLQPIFFFVLNAVERKVSADFLNTRYTVSNSFKYRAIFHISVGVAAASMVTVYVFTKLGFFASINPQIAALTGLTGLVSLKVVDVVFNQFGICGSGRNDWLIPLEKRQASMVLKILSATFLTTVAMQVAFGASIPVISGLFVTITTRLVCNELDKYFAIQPRVIDEGDDDSDEEVSM